MRKIFFHEDDFCQIEVLPASSHQHCLKQLQEIEEFSTAHTAPGGLGWTDVFLREGGNFLFSSLDIKANEITRAISTRLEPFDEVATGYATERIHCRQTRAFGSGPECTIFIEENEEGIAQNLWLSLDGPALDLHPNLLDALGEIGSIAPLILVDWGWGRLFNLTDRSSIEPYLKERLERFGAIQLEFQRRSEKSTAPKRRPWWKVFG